MEQTIIHTKCCSGTEMKSTQWDGMGWGGVGWVWSVQVLMGVVSTGANG